MMDLELFSTWGINDRNNAFVVENVLLFIPYGFVLLRYPSPVFPVFSSKGSRYHAPDNSR